MAAHLDTWQGANKSRRKACGECRRLKLRCEKVFPCESCQKRGCAAICPDGSFMKGTRSLKTSALKLHEKMSQMSTRIHDLEDALSILQASISAEPHPLLSNLDTGRPRSPIPVASVHEPNVPSGESPDELTAALGSLAIRPFGDSQFHGETASSEYLLEVNANQNGGIGQSGYDTSSRLRLPPDLILFSVLFPFPPSVPGEPLNGDRFLPYLPDYPEAVRICDVYFNDFSWCSLPIQKDDLDALMTEMYPNGQRSTNLQDANLHRLSLLLMVFAIGALFDIEKPLCPSEAEEYHSLARAALCGEQIFNNTTLDCVQSMSLMVWYMRMCPGRRSTGYLWAFSGLLSKLVQAIGLHRESTKPQSPAEITRRRGTFWEFISGDIWQSFVYGRPSSMVFSQIDCKKPREIGGFGGIAALFYKWKYSFTNLVGEVLAQTTGAITTSYRGFLEFDHKLRDFPVPPDLVLPESGSPGRHQEVPITLTLQRYVIRLWRHATIMYIHRRFLVQALRTHANDVMKSPYAPSVTAAYETACHQIGDLGELYAVHPRLISRLHPYWSHSFSASVLLGALVARSPSCPFSARAMDFLDQACGLFSSAAGRSMQPTNSLGLMINLQRKARIALDQYPNFQNQVPEGETHEEFVAIGAAGQVYVELGSKAQNGAPSSPSRSPSPDDLRPSQAGIMSTSRLGLLTPTSPTDIYNSSHHSPQSHANYHSQWLQQQAYYSPQPSSDGRETSNTPSSSGTGQLDTSAGIDQSEWPHSL
ncbi:fungal-specific transcription factor domain-containing protein [Gautieria morchelliformis]|nr:fungal-specific transcription factor domain-containing protein [Gautieria morchelliformis]